MPEQMTLFSPRKALEGFGDPRKLTRWPKGKPDYVSEFDLGPEHIPELIDLARFWVEREDWPEDDTDIAIYAPVHAWRALGQLRAAEAVEPLLAMMNAMDELNDVWYLEEFPDVFALIGPPAFARAADYLDNPENFLFPRICAAHMLSKIADRHPEQRDDAVSRFEGLLKNCPHNDSTLNAFLVSYLMNLKATESAEVIERAFAGRCVDEATVGGWGKVREELGVAGMGLAPSRSAAVSPFFPFNRSPDAPFTIDDAENRKRREKRRRQRKNRKRKPRS